MSTPPTRSSLSSFNLLQPENTMEEYEISPPPVIDRSQGRNVHIFNSSENTTPVGGLVLTNGLTNANLYSMVEIIVIVTSPFTLRSKDNDIITRDGNLLQPGSYYICSASRIYTSYNYLPISGIKKKAWLRYKQHPLISTPR
jgi:hypothetical protein